MRFRFLGIIFWQVYVHGFPLLMSEASDIAGAPFVAEVLILLDMVSVDLSV